MKRYDEMKFTRRMLVAITPVGVAIGLYEAWSLAGGMVFLMALQMIVLGLVALGVVRIIRREKKETG